MAARPAGVGVSLSKNYAPEISKVYVEGIVAGVIGAATIAVWFLILDVLDGRPLHTPTVLGAALFRHKEVFASPEHAAASFQLSFFYTWVHGLLFCVIGGVASKLLAVADKKPSLGFGILLLFVVFEFGFTVAAFVVAEPILHALAWPAILIGNLLAALAMGGYFWRHHPNLAIRP